MTDAGTAPASVPVSEGAESVINVGFSLGPDEHIGAMLQAHLDIGSGTVLAAYVEVLSGMEFPACGRWHKRHNWNHGGVVSDPNGVVRRNFACDRCGVAFEIDREGAVNRWQVRR